jgi:hypothetical protein
MFRVLNVEIGSCVGLVLYCAETVVNDQDIYTYLRRCQRGGATERISG